MTGTAFAILAMFWPKTAIFGPVPASTNGLNMVEHCQTHPGGSVWAFRAPKNVTREPQKRPKTKLFWLKIGHFWVLLAPPKWHFLGA